MSLVPDTSESTNQGGASSQKRSFVSSFLPLPRNVYLLLLFTTGKGFQLSISALTLNYYVHSLGYRPDFIGVFNAMPAVGALVSAVPVGILADRIGRKRMYLIGAVAMGIWGFVYFAMLNTMVPGWIFLAIVVSLIPHDMMYGPQAALIAECFSPRLRYSGSSLGFHLASLIAGGPAPLIATALLASTGSGYSVAIYILVCVIVSICATAFLPDYTNQDISREEAYRASEASRVPAEAPAGN